MATPQEVKTQIQTTEQLLNQKRQEAQTLKQGIQAYQNKLPQTSSQKFLRTTSSQNPLAQRLQRQKITQARQSSDKALQQISKYEQGIQEYQTTQINPVKQQIANYETEVEAQSQAYKFFSKGIPLNTTEGTPVYKYLKAMYQNQAIQSQSSQELENQLSQYAQSTMEGVKYNIPSDFTYQGKTLEQLQNQGIITFKEQVPTFTSTGLGGMQSKADFEKYFKPVEEQKFSTIQPTTTSFSSQSQWEVQPAQDRGVVGDIGNLFQKGFQKVFGGKTLKEVEAHIIPNPNRDDTNLKLGFYPSAGQVIKDVSALPRNVVVDFASPLVGEGLYQVADKTIPKYKGGLITIPEKTIKGGWREVKPLPGTTINTQPRTEFFEDRIIPSKELFERKKILEGIRIGGGLGTTIAGFTYGGNVLLASSVSAGTQTVFNPKLSTTERVFGGVEAGLSLGGLGYSGYKQVLIKPRINRFDIGDSLKLKSSAVIGDDVLVQTEKGVVNKVLFNPQKTSQTNIPGSRAEVRTLWDDIFKSKIKVSKGTTGKIKFEWVKADPVFSGVTYADKEGYKKALELLMKQGYSESAARSLIRYTAPQQIDEVTEGLINIKGNKASGQFKVSQEKIVKNIDEALGIKTRGGKKVVDVFDFDRVGASKGDSGIFFETGTRTRTLFDKNKFFGVETGEYSIGTGLTKTSESIQGLKPQKVGDLNILEESQYKDIYSFSAKQDIFPSSTKINLDAQRTILFESNINTPIKDIGFRGGGKKSSDEFLQNLYSNTKSLKAISPKISEPVSKTKSVSTIAKPTSTVSKPISIAKPTSTTTQSLTSSKISTTTPNVYGVSSQSIYTGTGQYELTESTTGQILNNRERQGTIGLSLSLPKSSQENKLSLNQSNNLNSLSLNNFNQKDNLDIKQSTKINNAQTSQSSTQEQTTKDPLSIRPQPPRQQQRPRPEPQPPKPKPFGFFQNRINKKVQKKKILIGGDKFLAITKRKGKEIILGEFKTIQQAERVAKRSALSTLGATVKVSTSSGKKIQLREDKLFRLGKTEKTSLVQRQFGIGRIASLGEKREIKKSRRFKI